MRRNIVYWSLQVLVTINGVFATWLFKEEKLCNPSGGGIIPFSGFKIYREFKFQGVIPIPIHYLILVRCNHGNVDFKTLVRTPESVVTWDLPFCMLKPKLGKMFPLPPDDTVEKLNLTVTFGKRNLQDIGDLLRYKIDSKLEKLTKGKFVQYTGNRLLQHQIDIRDSSPQKVLEWESRDLICYKMARRKKYSKLKLSFYMPDTFVGGLYECPVSSEMKQNILSKMTTNEILQPLANYFSCDESTARPIMPLLASDAGRQWIRYSVNPFRPTFWQTIPFLTTVSPFDLRFAATNSPDSNTDTWASMIKVNEDYDFSTPDIHVISSAIALTTDYINRLFIFNLSMVPFELGRARIHHSEGAFPKKTLIKHIQNLGVEEKLYTFIGLFPYATINTTLSHIQLAWNKVHD